MLPTSSFHVWGSLFHPVQPSLCIKHGDVHLVLGFVPGAGNTTTALPLTLLLWSLIPTGGTEADSYTFRHTTDGEMRPHSVYMYLKQRRLAERGGC